MKRDLTKLGIHKHTYTMKIENQANKRRCDFLCYGILFKIITKLYVRIARNQIKKIIVTDFSASEY